ncbi:MAG: hypothetical protein M3326_04195 [Actinomycetota bacterium]|nr:hypothetical protein [Actinomycetota bacterium]
MSVNQTFQSIERHIPAWIGFVLIILAGAAAIAVGAAVGPGGLVPFGVAAIASAIVAWVSGARSTPRVNPFEKSWGATVKDIDGWAWAVVFLLFAAAVVIALLV